MSTIQSPSRKKFYLFFAFEFVVFVLLYIFFRAQSNSVIRIPETNIDQDNAVISSENSIFTAQDEAALTDTFRIGRDVDSMTNVEKEQAIADALIDFPPSEMTNDQKSAEASSIASMLVADEVTTQLSASFEGRAHPGSGNVRIVQEGQKRVLIFEDDFRTDPGPQLHVFLSGTKDPKNSADLHAVGDADLGRLKSTSGAQMYTLPEELNFDIRSVVVYCVPFKVIFSVANF